MKVILLALFIGWALTSLRGLFKTSITSVKDEAEKAKKPEETVKNTWKALAFLTIFIIAGLYIWATSAVNTPYAIIGSAIAIVFALYGYGKAVKQIDGGQIVAGPSVAGLYSVIFKSYIVYELVRQILI
jgi:hypothetical protein